jgi:hypothetical protein
MRKNVITVGRLKALQRVEQYIADHPHCTAPQIGAALSIKKTTLNGYTLDLRRMKRISRIVPSQVNVHGSLPDTYQVMPDLDPLSADRPVILPRRPESALRPDPVKRMDLVAALFGPAGGTKGKRITS